MNPLTHAERQALGRHARKQLARRAHGDFKREICPADPLAILAESMKGRVPRLVPIKYQRMAASPFGFFRGAVPIMAADLACHPNTGLVTQLCGDAHVENLGAYASMDNRIVFDLNDFDETIRGPFEWDIKRLATSLILAGREAGIRRVDRWAAVSTFLRRYRRTMRRFSNMPVLELARWQSHRLGHLGPMPAIFAQAERSTPVRLLEKLTEPVDGNNAQAVAKKTTAAKTAAKKTSAAAKKAANTQAEEPEHIPSQPRRFRSEPPLLERVGGADARKVLASLEQYRKALQPERQHFLAQYTAIDVAFKVVGTGSVGLRDYVVYMEGHTRPAHSDPLFIQIKEEPASGYARYIPDGAAAWKHQGHRVMDGQRAMQLTSDPFLGYTTIENRDYLVRQLNDHKAALDLATLTVQNLHGYADLCGELLARGHARGGDPVSIHAYIGSSARFDDAIFAFGKAYADKTEADWDELGKWLKRNPKAAGGERSQR